jgi:hypothetical protein
MKRIDPERLLACLATLHAEAQACEAVARNPNPQQAAISNSPMDAVKSNWMGYAEGISYCVAELTELLGITEEELQQALEEMSARRLDAIGCI